LLQAERRLLSSQKQVNECQCQIEEYKYHIGSLEQKVKDYAQLQSNEDQGIFKTYRSSSHA
jgi:hypothetical protein